MGSSKKRHWQGFYRIGLASLVLASFAALPLGATPVALRCSIQDSYLTADYKTAALGVEVELCTNLKVLFGKYLEFLAWDYILAPGVADVALELRLVNRGESRELEFHLQRKDFLSTPWSAIWKKPGDGKPDPVSQRAAAFFSQKVEELLLRQSGEAITKQLRLIPVASARWSVEGAPRLESDLSWKEHKALRASKFRVTCKGKDSKMELVSEVQQMADAYQGPFLLLATHRLPERQAVGSILGEVKQLSPQTVFLLELVPPDAPDTF